MRLALAVYGSIQAVQDDDEYKEKNNRVKVEVTLCLLHVEEDEAEEGIPFAVQPNGDNEELITRQECFSSLVDVSFTSSNSHQIPVTRRQLGSDGKVVFALDLEHEKHPLIFSFNHKATGLQLVLRLSEDCILHLTNTITIRDNNIRSANLKNDSDGEDESSNTCERDESDDDGLVIGGVDAGVYEEDDFIVFDEEDTKSHDECFTCGQGGELLICDGGDHSEGCRRGFHLVCVGLDAIPDGDWICSSCASTAGLATDKRGHEFPIKNSKPKDDFDESDCDFKTASGKMNCVKDRNAKEHSSLKRRIILESDCDDDDD